MPYERDREPSAIRGSPAGRLALVLAAAVVWLAIGGALWWAFAG